MRKTNKIKEESTRLSTNKTDLLDMLREQPDLWERLSEYLQKGERLVLEKESELIKIHSENYMVVDTDVLNYIKSKISATDYEKLFSLGVFLKTKFNILFNHTRPFTLETLSKKLGINKDNTNKFIKRMVEQQIMAYTVCAPSGYVSKIYSINPQLMRRGNWYDKEFVTTYFTDFSKEIEKENMLKARKPNEDEDVQ